VDKFLDSATEVDVDCLADYDAEGSRGEAIIIGVMEHIEEAGIHSGDSACALPPYSLSKKVIAELKRQTKELAKALRVRGLMNVQYAIKGDEIFVIEVNPRASRTVPFVGKATGVPWAKIAAKVMAGKTLKELGIFEPPDPKHVSVKEVVFPFSKFPGVDVILGPEMRSTGEVMGIDQTFEIAFAKSQIAAGGALPTRGTVFISVRNEDKQAIVPIAKQFQDCGFEIVATGGTYDALAKNGITTRRIPKLSEGRPNIIDLIKNRQVQLLINTPTKKGPQTDEGKIRAMSVLNKVPIVTTLTGAHAAVRAIAALKKGDWGVRPLQEYH
jgi:carbamoyl-phosphate synthase large subunit